MKDPRANPTIGWVFGTYQYEKDASTSANWWDHLVPVGLMWGSDVERLKLDQQTRENWINTQRGVKLHLGRKDLVLNGPVDNPRGSCTSCHGFAQVPKVNGAQPSLPTAPPALNASAATLEKYFKNIKAATALSSDYTSLDYHCSCRSGLPVPWRLELRPCRHRKVWARRPPRLVGQRRRRFLRSGEINRAHRYAAARWRPRGTSPRHPASTAGQVAGRRRRVGSISRSSMAIAPSPTATPIAIGRPCARQGAPVATCPPRLQHFLAAGNCATAGTSRIGVHAAASRWVAVLHADDDARHRDRRGAEAGAGERPGHQAGPGGRSRTRQGGARGAEH